MDAIIQKFFRFYGLEYKPEDIINNYRTTIFMGVLQITAIASILGVALFYFMQGIVQVHIIIIGMINLFCLGLLKWRKSIDLSTSLMFASYFVLAFFTAINNDEPILKYTAVAILTILAALKNTKLAYFSSLVILFTQAYGKLYVNEFSYEELTQVLLIFIGNLTIVFILSLYTYASDQLNTRYLKVQNSSVSKLIMKRILHEVNNPLMVITGKTALFKRKKEYSEEYADIIEKKSYEISNLIFELNSICDDGALVDVLTDGETDIKILSKIRDKKQKESA